MANLINEAKRMQHLAGILNESQLNEIETRTYDLRDILKNKHVNDNKSNDISVFKVGMDVLPSRYYKSMDEIRTELGKVTKISGNKVFYKTFDIEAGFGFSGNKGEEKSAEPQDLIIATGLTTESQELNEVEDAEEFRKQVEAGQTTIQATISMPQEKEGTVWKSGTEKVGTIVLKNLKRLDKLKYEGILENDGGHKPLVPFKGKKLILGDFPEIGNGSLTDEEGAKDITKGIRILFKLKTWPEFVGGQQAESLDNLDEIVDNVLEKLRGKEEVNELFGLGTTSAKKGDKVVVTYDKPVNNISKSIYFKVFDKGWQLDTTPPAKNLTDHSDGTVYSNLKSFNSNKDSSILKVGDVTKSGDFEGKITNIQLQPKDDDNKDLKKIELKYKAG